MKFNDDIPVYGDTSYRNKKCPSENAEQITFFNVLRRDYPELGAIAIHIKNEGKRSYNQASRDKASGMVAGAADIVIPGCPSFICELKRQDHTLSRWQNGQIDYLLAAKANGSFVCVALGYKYALVALNNWVKALH